MSVIDKIYPTYDGGYMGPSNISITSGYPPMMSVPNIPFEKISNGINDINFSCNPTEVEDKQLWQVCYTMPGQYNWTTAYVVATSMSDAIVLCKLNGIPEDSITTMKKMEASRVLC
jgi:hypothetical protein